MIEIYCASDADSIELSPTHRAIADGAAQRLALRHLADKGLVWSSHADGKILAILGAVPSGGGEECEVFIFPSAALAKHHPFTLFKDVSAKLTEARKRFKVVRSITRPDLPAANRFLAHLGFVREGRRGEFLTWVYP